MGQWVLNPDAERGALTQYVWTAQSDVGQAAQTASDFYGSTYDPTAGWSI